MPSDTFFRLPEAKRERLMEAAWEEFTAVRCADASINKIIQSAGIPRGSFYQYFADKDDLFQYLVRPLQQHFIEMARQAVERCSGNLTRAPLAIYDSFFYSEQSQTQDLMRCIRIIQRNPEQEFHNLFCAPDAPIHSFAEMMDTAPLRRRDPAFLQEMIHLLIFTIASSIIDALNAPDRKEPIRQQLQLRVDILMQGCLAAPQGGTL